MGQRKENTALGLYTTGELEKLHRSFGHPSVISLFNVLICLRVDHIDNRLSSAIEDLVNRWKIGRNTARKRSLVKLIIGTELDRFNQLDNRSGHYV